MLSGGSMALRTDETLRTFSYATTDSRRVSLLVSEAEQEQIIPLLADQPVVVGRGEEADLTVEDPGVSRLHARFVLRGDAVWVEDVGSTNGTRLNGTPVVRERVRVGDEVVLGAVSVRLHVSMPMAAHLGIDSHDRFHVALIDEVIRAKTFGRQLALLMVRIDRASETPLLSWGDRIRASLRPVDRIGAYGPRTFEVILPEMDENGASAIAASIATVSGSDTQELLHIGGAVFPGSARSAEELIEQAGKALRQAEPSQRIQIIGFRADSQPRPPVVLDHEGPVVHNPAMVEVFATVDKVAPSTIPVLIMGETGTGKEVVASAIHHGSQRQNGPMRCVNCGAIPGTLVESVLFGYERGAFTGADRQSKGIFEQAHGGTVFLDEIGELAPSAQIALLRVLENHRLTRVGGRHEIEVDVRVLAATHCDLQRMCEQGAFRLDLYYRLNTLVIDVPPLRDRSDEIPLLVDHFIALANEKNATHVQGIADDAMALLVAYAWPGNVRELRNVVERAVVIAKGSVIAKEALPARLRQSDAVAVDARLAQQVLRSVPEVKPALLAAEATPTPGGFKTQVQQFEAGLIRAALTHTGGNQTQAAQELGMARRTFVHKLGILGIQAEDQSTVTSKVVWKPGDGDFKQLVGDFENRLLSEALQKANGNRALAARNLGMSLHGFCYRAKKHGLIT